VRASRPDNREALNHPNPGGEGGVPPHRDGGEEEDLAEDDGVAESWPVERGSGSERSADE
jgi:hypothetical protein